jgi:stage III sporulation protein AA
MEDQAFLNCVQILPRPLRTALMGWQEGRSECWEEIRLRVERGISVHAGGPEQPILLGGKPLLPTQQDLYAVIELATQSSYQSAEHSLRTGYFTLRGGHRIGVTGTASLREGQLSAFQALSSLNIRIARSHPGIAGSLEQKLLERGRFPGTLIVSPPGAGKTTLLRELVRLLSDGCGLRVGLADERGEVAALWHGVPQLSVGASTDVLDGCPKAEGMLLLLRSMNPQILAADEITAPADVEAITICANCGVSVLATAHAATVEELQRRPLYRSLLEQRVFRRIIRISRGERGGRIYAMEPLSW